MRSAIEQTHDVEPVSSAEKPQSEFPAVVRLGAVDLDPARDEHAKLSRRIGRAADLPACRPALDAERTDDLAQRMTFNPGEQWASRERIEERQGVHSDDTANWPRALMNSRILPVASPTHLPYYRRARGTRPSRSQAREPSALPRIVPRRREAQDVRMHLVRSAEMNNWGRQPPAPVGRDV